MSQKLVNKQSYTIFVTYQKPNLYEFDLRYASGVIPVFLRKVRQKSDGARKFSESEIWFTFKSVVLSLCIAWATTKSSIHLRAFFPVVLLTTWERYFGVMQSLSA